MKYTRQDLDALSLKGDVQKVATGLGLDASGTRKEITDRILASQKGKSAAKAAPAPKAAVPVVAEAKVEVPAPAPKAAAPAPAAAPVEGRRARRARRAAALAAADAGPAIAAYVQKHARRDGNDFAVKFCRVEYRAGMPYQLEELVRNAIIKGRGKLSALKD